MLLIIIGLFCLYKRSSKYRESLSFFSRKMAAPMKMIRTSVRHGLLQRLWNKASVLGSVRCLHLQEYQSKKLMQENGISVQKFVVASNFEEAEHATDHLDVKEYVIKAQILAGGRGKGVFSNGFQGGVHLTKDKKQVPFIVENMLGSKLKTKQTVGDGVLVQKVTFRLHCDQIKECRLC
ncbi:succinyl-CoA synthetase beta subunit [Mytilus galloprovincialis]|uniref:Succinyl-CoA synthetase beta subunit n=1 Tax=Mytilus galloprovincialis TaxID=29158 RepID=A0A8B6D7Z7_MYTGA|nr:succinyl-CoA synthetase beta subunit [Mytilus galloprovincialis]